MDIQKLSIKKRRVMIYFIEAARQLMSSDGIQALSIRGIAEIAGYNSATLYNYFEDLQHLTLFASMSYLRDYVSALSGKLKAPMSSLQRYRVIYETFDHFAFRSPEIFYNMFFGSQSSKLPEVTVQYYTLFPDELKEHTPSVRKMLTQGNMYLRDEPIVEELVKDGFVKRENAPYLSAIVPRLNQTYLHELANGERIDPEEQHRRFIAAFDYLLETAK